VVPTTSPFDPAVIGVALGVGLGVGLGTGQ